MLNSTEYQHSVLTVAKQLVLGFMPHLEWLHLHQHIPHFHSLHFPLGFIHFIPILDLTIHFIMIIQPPFQQLSLSACSQHWIDQHSSPSSSVWNLHIQNRILPYPFQVGPICPLLISSTYRISHRLFRLASTLLVRGES